MYWKELWFSHYHAGFAILYVDRAHDQESLGSGVSPVLMSMWMVILYLLRKVKIYHDAFTMIYPKNCNHFMIDAFSTPNIFWKRFYRQVFNITIAFCISHRWLTLWKYFPSFLSYSFWNFQTILNKKENKQSHWNSPQTASKVTHFLWGDVGTSLDLSGISQFFVNLHLFPMKIS